MHWNPGLAESQVGVARSGAFPQVDARLAYVLVDLPLTQPIVLATALEAPAAIAAADTAAAMRQLSQRAAVLAQERRRLAQLREAVQLGYQAVADFHVADANLSRAVGAPMSP